MEWKNGKHTGRTVRSHFAQTRGKRSEGLLMRCAVTNSSSDGIEDEGELVTYSLGKQNRWLLPEVIKANSVEFEGEVILVERCEGNKKHRPGSLSVFNSKKNNPVNDTNQKPKRKHTRSKDFPRSRDGEESEMKTRYEVTYPHLAGSWSKSTNRPAAHLGKRKKNYCSSWMLEDDFDDLSDIEYHESEDEEDFSEQFERSSSLEFDFDLFVGLSSHTSGEVTTISSSQSGKSMQSKEHESALAGKCIYIESDDEIHETHLKFLAQITAGCSLLDVKNKPGVQKGCRHRGARNLHNESPEQSLPPVDTSSVPVEPALHVSDREEGIVITLRRHEVAPATLAQQWGKMYIEGACYPRTFLLNVAPILNVPNSKEVFIVFRVIKVQCSNFVSGDVKACVALVVCNDDANTDRIPNEFHSCIQAKSADQETWKLEDIVSITALVVSSCTKAGRVDYKEPRQPRLSLDVFADLFGWKSKTYSLQGAQQEMKESVTKARGNEATSAVVAYAGHEWQLECEICFKEMQNKGSDINSCFMSLNACGHKFCDDCWRAHLKTQIQLGHTDLRCPGHECTAVVDDVTLMSLLPSWYNRHLSKRLDTFLEMDPEWKWCPADQCKLVVKATTPQDPPVICDAHVNCVQSVPVVCVCGTMWCFQCQEDAHWPATCEEARTFREKNASYARLVTKTSKKNMLITSVQVKHCPSCYYPMEKGMGCDHMTCVLCYNQFCWLCLGKWSYSHHCRTHVNLRKVKLQTKLVHVVSYEHVAVTSRVARTSSLICKIHRKLERIEKELNIYTKCFPLKPGTSNAEKQVKLLVENNAAGELKEVFNFKFQALLVLEGAAIRLAVSKDTPCSKKLAMEFSRLLFIVERMDEILKDLNSCLGDKDCLFRLKHFVTFGKNCIIFIGRNTKQTTAAN